jgi:hypothetical protein
MLGNPASHPGINKEDGELKRPSSAFFIHDLSLLVSAVG